jgi:hypothetical protein
MTTFVRFPRAPRRSVNRVKAPSILGAAMAGVPATYVMDLAGREIVAPAFGKGPSGNLGRWIGHMVKGRFTHEDITKAAPVPHEAAIGTAAHYAIGFVLGAGYALLLRVPNSRQNSLSRALAYGIATTVFPWFWMFPARGQGIMGLRDRDVRVPAFALATHVAYGFGLGVALRVADSRLSAGPERRTSVLTLNAPPRRVGSPSSALRRASWPNGGQSARFRSWP